MASNVVCVSCVVFSFCSSICSYIRGKTSVIRDVVHSVLYESDAVDNEESYDFKVD